ncbi:hypothetical protein M2G93_17060 [Vibrio vulnificus]|nr:hypothetical protein [Vibrio vulnificus]
MIPNVTNSGTMPITGGHAGPSTATSSNQSGQSVGGINMGSRSGVNPWLIAGVIIVLAFLLMKSK